MKQSILSLDKVLPLSMHNKVGFATFAFVKQLNLAWKNTIKKLHVFLIITSTATN